MSVIRPARSRVRPVALAALFTVVGATSLTACGTETLDSGKVESTIVEQFKAQGVELTDVSCGKDVEAKVGAPINCTGNNGAGTVLRLEGKVSERDGDRVQFAVKAVGGTASGTVVAEQAKAMLEAKVGEKAKGMTCPESVELPTPKPVECTLTTNADQEYAVQVSFDAEGNISAEVADAPSGTETDPTTGE